MMEKHIAVIGGGVAGLESGCRLADAGFRVSIFEKNEIKGGHLNDWYKLFPDRRPGSEVSEYFRRMVDTSGVTINYGTGIERIRENRKSFILCSDKGEEIAADAVVVATGFDLFRNSKKEEYGYGIYDNVISSADLEAMFRKGEILRNDGKSPKKIGFVHCVGSRDEKSGNLYCSKLCCVTAVKQAIEIREHLPDSSVFCFYMDMRMGGAYYEELYREAQEEWSVNFIRGRVSEVSETVKNTLTIKIEDTLASRPLKMECDMLVLMSGMEMSEGGKRLAEASRLATGENRFFAVADHHFGSNRSNIDGIFLAGACTMPMNITETISHARAVVSDVVEFLRNRTE